MWSNTAANVLARRTLNVPVYRQRFLDTLLEAAAAAGNNGWLASEVERIHAQIRQAVIEDPHRVCLREDRLTDCPESIFHESVNWVRAFARDRAAFVQSEVREAGGMWPTGAPQLIAGAASNGASRIPLLSPGALSMLRMSSSGLQTANWAASLPLPTELAAAEVVVGGVPAPMVMVSPSEVEFQVPFELPCGPTSIAFRFRGVASNTITAEIRPSAPGVFVVTHADGRLVDRRTPAAPGELLVAWATGLGHGRGEEKNGSAAPIPAATVRETHRPPPRHRVFLPRAG